MWYVLSLKDAKARDLLALVCIQLEICKNIVLYAIFFPASLILNQSSCKHGYVFLYAIASDISSKYKIFII